MKKTLCLLAGVAALVLSSSTPAIADLIAYEGFDYAAGADLSFQNGGFGWATAWGTNSSGITTGGQFPGASIKAGNLTYADTAGNTLVTSGNSLFMTGTNGTSQPFRTLNTVMGTNGGSAWVSFMAYRSGTPTNNTLQPFNPYPRGANVSFYSTNSERVAIGNSSGAVSNMFSIVPTGSSSNIRQSGYDYSNLSLVVLRFDFADPSAPNTNDAVYMFINPSLGIEPSLADAAASTNNWFDFTFNRVRPFAGGNANNQPYAELSVDEIRIGTTFADVTPFTPVPEPSVVALGGVGLLAFAWGMRRRH